MKTFPAGMGIVVVAFLGTAGCGSDSQSLGEVACSILSPGAEGVIHDTVDVRVAVSGPALRVELLAGNEIVASRELEEATIVDLPWDSRMTPDGPVRLVARAVFGEGMEARSGPVSLRVDNTAPRAVFGGELSHLQVVSGQLAVPLVVDEANPASIRILDGDRELFSSSEMVGSYNWDTTAADDGVHELVLEVEDVAGRIATATLAVVVVNHGEEFQVTYLPADELYIPEDYQTTEHHVRVSIDSQPGVDRILSWIRWDPHAAWNIEYAVGQGLCPHNGIRYTAASSSEGEILIDLSRQDLEDEVIAQLPADERDGTLFPYNDDPRTFGAFFGHVAALDPADHVGETLPFEVHFILFYAD